MFSDLHYECLQLTANTIEDRVSQLSSILPTASLTALGGFPFEKYPNNTFIWCGHRLASDTDIQNIIKKALGLSAVLTYTNPKSRSLAGLGDLCLENKHFWALHWINIGITLARHTPAVELAFARDTRFMLTWPIKSNPSGQVFTATAGIKEWMDYTAHRDDTSFDPATRAAMHQSYEIIKRIIPCHALSS